MAVTSGPPPARSGSPGGTSPTCARTYQDLRLFEESTVPENVLIGRRMAPVSGITLKSGGLLTRCMMHFMVGELQMDVQVVL